MKDTNKDILLTRLNDLLTKPVYTCLKVYSKGNEIYLLKDSNYQIYILIVPQAPLNENQRNALKSLGYKEIWEKVNFEKYINYSDSSLLYQLIDSVDSILTEIFKVQSERKWRYDLNTGMAVLKDNKTPLLTANERIKKGKRERVFSNRIFNDITYSLALSVIIFIGLFSKNLIDSLTIKIILIVFGISYIFIKIGRFITKLEISSFGKKRFMGRDYSDYFMGNGFKKYGDRYKGEIQGFLVELMFSDLHKYMIIVYHKEISWNRVLKMPKGKPFSSTSYNWTGMFYSQKMIKRRLSKEKIMNEAKDFVELIINQKIEKQHTANTQYSQ